MNQHLPKAIDGLIFDLDGTLWDASNTCTQAWNQTFKESGHGDHVLDDATIRSWSGMKVEKIFDQYLDFIPKSSQEEVLERYKHQESLFMKRYGGELFPGVKDVLRELSESFKLFIVSNCLAGYIENFISFNQLDGLFTDFESSGNTGLAKSDNINLIIERNELHYPVYIGDTVWDQEAAGKSNVPFIYAAYGFGKANRPEITIAAFDELRQLLLT
ncbi:HAD-IA family hydrolase [Pedobacter sp. HMF7647]|uniref:phosphoglycolate phosphatase n=1 Tax=Hufsiella arboris TaxID=2695275 RepID=A0A7K1Y4V5_9SPHI|nr:HAD family hydrolase [Hufsiella arboris]MXV49613.1 HAD-IA family hydrolase [Hufsiella arboris]